MLCGEGTLVNQGVYGVRAISLKCRSWGCENCAWDRRRQLTAMAMSGQPNTFITLTVDPSRFGSPINRARELVIAWRAVVKAACRRYGYSSIPYLCVFEATKRGEPHLHILCRVPWIDQNWLSKLMDNLIGAPIVDIRRIKSSRQVAAYVAKYVGKAPHRFGTCKRYWTTRDYSNDTYQPPEEPWHWSKLWQVRTMHIDDYMEIWEGWGWKISMNRYMVTALERAPPNDEH